MNLLDHYYVFLILCFSILNDNYLLQAKADLAVAPMQTSFIDEIIEELNNISCKGDQSLQYLEKIVEFCALRKKDYGSLKGIFKLFSNRYKGVEYLTAHQMSSFLHSLYVYLPQCANPPCYTTILNDPASFDRFTSTMKTQLIKDFSTRFHEFKLDPEIFIATLAQKITQQAEQEMNLAQMQYTIIRLLEIAISKTIWSPYDQEKTWENVQHISKQFVLLLEENIIGDVDALDDLLWSLIHRYCYFLELTGSLLTSEFYKKVLHDIDNKNLLISIVEEQDELLKSKKLFLKEKVLTAQAKALAGTDKKNMVINKSNIQRNG
ncbi:MAG TPA: hypothetical protein VL201_05650 [Patescibacteria group bacterium]|jgi:hypothetical protein|nr:hypothetical protein [Patescibacteria group bacterium]